ncbi:MAG: hypothetical protein CL930_04670 [Deltaproteobacteria bacterium]|nr:hypothetical protein [Deltaproteobacteria bacterium]
MSLKEIFHGLSAIWRAWAWFWFSPISAKGTGVMRVLLGLMLVMTTIDIFPDLETLIGPNGLFHASSAKRGFRMSRWTYFDQIPTLWGMQLAHGAALVANLLFMFGYKSRTMGFLSLVAHAALYQRNSWFMNGGDRLIRECTLYICLVPCGAAYSVDAWLKKRKAFRRGRKPIKNPLIPVLGMRMVQIQVAIMYLLSGLEKWEAGTWQRGSALYYSLSSGNYQRSDQLVAPLLDTSFGHKLTEIGTAITLYWEVGFIVLVLWRPTRWLTLISGVFIHAGIHLMLMVAFFSSISMWCYLAYLPYDWVERLEKRWQARGRAKV